MTTNAILLGKAAEHLFIAHLLREGIECFLPVSDGGRIDVIVGPCMARCQIKVISRTKKQDGLPVRKRGGQNYHVYRYTSEDIDFMIGILPEEVKSPRGRTRRTRDR